jgi:hypothetical protein
MLPDEDDLSIEALPATGSVAFALLWHERGVDFPISGDSTTIRASHVR